MKKIFLLTILLTFLYSCGVREVQVPVPITVTIKENQTAEIISEVKFKTVPLYEEKLKYLGEKPPVTYVFTNQRSNIRTKPHRTSRKMGTTIRHEKLELLGTVNGSRVSGSKVWYKINQRGKIGYIHSSVAIKRTFEFEQMAKKVRKLEVFLDTAKKNNRSIERIIAYEPESKEEEGHPKDSFGSRGEQSVVAHYVDSNKKSRFRYLQDGRIVAINDDHPALTKLTIPDSDSNFLIPGGRTRKLDVKDGINKVILIDIKNQTEAAFEKEEDVWNLVGYNIITSGRNNNKHAYDTPKGYFIVQNTLTFIVFAYKEKELKEEAIAREEKLKEEFNEKEIKRVRDLKKKRATAVQMFSGLFFNETPISTLKVDEEELKIKHYTPKYTAADYEEIEKYSRANYGIRFSGGGYLHGIPLKDETVEKLEEQGGDEAVMARKKISERNLGTFKASHKCVRNVEEFQSFLYHDFIGYKSSYFGRRWRLPAGNVAVIVY